MDVIKYTRPRFPGDLIAYECDQNFTRENRTLLAGSGSTRDAVQFQVLGTILHGALSLGTVTFSGTGNGVLTPASPAVAAGAAPGVWRAVFVDPETDAGGFLVLNPSGDVEGPGKVGVAYTGSVKFTIADGSTDFAGGAAFALPVLDAGGSGKVVPLNLSATDGSQIASDVAIYAASAPDAVDVPIATLARGPAIVRPEELIWPAGITDPQKATALAQLAALGILARTSG